MKRRSIVATICAVLGLLSAGLIGVGALAANLGVVTPMTGFSLFAPGALLGLLALLFAVPAWLATAPAKNRGGRGAAVLGALLGAGVVAVVLAAALPASDLPRINDITTNPVDPPTFRAAQSHAPNAGRDLSYPREFADPQRAGYPDLLPIELDAEPAAAFAAVEAGADALGWTSVESDADAGHFEAYEVSGIFRFVDDVVVRVRPGDAGGSVVDIRSKSRDGRGDLGANAARIRALRAELTK